MKHLMFVSFVISTSLWAGGEIKPYSVCPMVTEDAKVILTSIQTIQDDLKKLPECQTVGSKITTISNVLNDKSWKNVKEMLKTTAAPQLEAAEVQKISALVSEATLALSDTIAQLSNGSSHCIPKENKASFLGTLSGIVKDVSGVVGNVAGPYGAAISLGGNLLSGVIEGIDKLFKMNKIYDFKKPAEEMLFMNQFCAFTQAQQDINDFLSLETKEQELIEMADMYLRDIKIKDLVENCPECKAYKLAWDANEAATRITKRIIEDANIIDSNINPALQVSYTRCAEINRAFYTENSDFSQLINLFEKYENPMMSQSDLQQIKETVDLAKNKLKGFFPKYADCVGIDNQNISTKFNNFMRDEILRLTDNNFGQQMRQFQFLANKKYRDPNGDYIASSLDRAKWARIERDKVIKKLKEGNYKVDKEKVKIARSTLKKRIVSQLMPVYLKYRFKDNKKNINQFVRQFQKFRSNELNYFNTELSTEAQNLVELTDILKKDESLYETYSRYFVSSYDELFSKSELLILKESNNIRYCEYLDYSISKTTKSREICKEGEANIKLLLHKIDGFKSDIDAISAYDKWAHKKLKIQSSFVKDYADRIREWTTRGDDRWIEIAPPVHP